MHIEDDINSGKSVGRRAVLRGAALAAGGFGLSGCEGLKNLDSSAGAEGTGLQFSGFVKVLATYRSTPNQQVVANRSAGKTYVETALRPAYQKRRKSVESSGAAKVEAVKKSYVKKKQIAKREADPVALAKGETDEAQEVAKAVQSAETQVSAVDKSWQQLAVSSSAGAYDASDIRIATTTVPVAVASVRSERAQLLASANDYIAPTLAVSVPKANIVSVEKDAADSIMLWDTQQHTLNSSTVYVIDRKPKVGNVTKFGNVSAEYVGKGS